MRLPTLICAACVTWAGCAAQALDEPPIEEPQPLAAESPFRYPIELWDRGVEGLTMLEIHVREDGAVDSVRVQTSSGFAAFDSAAVAGAWELRFSPARQAGQPIPRWVHLPVRFSRDSVAPAPARRDPESP